MPGAIDGFLLRLSPKDFRRTAWFRYAFALAAVLVVSLLVFVVSETFGDHARPLTLLVLAVVLSAWFGGLGPGLFATALSSLVVQAFLVDPDPLEEATILSLATFVVVALVTTSLYDALHHAKDSEEHLRDEVVAADELVGFVSHELRNPAAIIMGNLSLLSRDPQIRGNDALKATVAFISDEAAELARIIEHLLVLSTSGEHASISKEPVLLPRLLAAQTRSHQARFPQRPIELQCADDCALVEANDDHLRMIFHNLVENAEKYSPDLSAPVEVVVSRLSQKEVAIRVLDRGVGITQSEAESIFESFYRSDSVRAAGSGFGLGLAVCKRLEEAGGGRIWAMPRPGGGSEFGFTVSVLEFPGEDGRADSALPSLASAP